mmetsp:Transcript_60392/g.143962  ORF Transcript_60392/g.143962 Transcript_60392/m.143962 type:complete len:892 (+) Transcript_60392:44-2719(+)|eukprot:CAMPEP_0178403520 /NCGR_PEP_ID=MMETSP0689_2-20121128/17411_1 /TAXON_ID=160604 /ORGANISM="Amphidinium massartii, Strain CS-259" /LENGTH=891 /DNA_ID=CAMNT_0020024477 /DNA_START=49 /DNA_END=2724 /DNA_ORIENTATION=+
MADRVDVPASSVSLFTDRPGGGAPPRAPLKAVAEALNYKNAAELISTVRKGWPSFEAQEATISAAELVALVQLLQFQNGVAARMMTELRVGGATRMASLSTLPLTGLPDDGKDDILVDDHATEHRETPKAKRQARAEPPPWATCEPEDVGMDADTLVKCKRYLSYRVSRKHFSGIVGGVVKNGKLVYFDEVGYADMETKAPMKQDTIMRLFSMTKCIVVVAFLSYQEEQHRGIDLEDPVWKYLPAFRNTGMVFRKGQTNLETKEHHFKSLDGTRDEKVVGPIGPTLRQLLTHTAGFGYGPTLGDKWPPEKTDHYRIYESLLEKVNKGEISNLSDFTDELAKVPLKVKPGSYWEYSFATDVLGRVIEVISGKDLEEAVQEKVCRPLGMVDTSFRVPVEKLNRVGAWYQRKPPLDDKGNPIEKVQPGATYNLDVVDKAGAESGWAPDRCSKILSGGGTVEVPLAMKGGMVSTFRDYLRFLIMIRNMGELDGIRILRRDTVQNMLCNQVPAATGSKTKWVFDKKGQGYNFLGQIQVQFQEKDTYLEKGAIKKGNNTFACLSPGTVSGEFGWGGLGGPAWTIDPRADLIILSMTQTALELDHEEVLRFSARRAIHAGIWGTASDKTKVTDYPPEFHTPSDADARKKAAAEKLRRSIDGKFTEEEQQSFAEAEAESFTRRKTLKELAVASGNVGHEFKEPDEDAQDGQRAAQDDEPAISPRNGEKDARAMAIDRANSGVTKKRSVSTADEEGANEAQQPVKKGRSSSKKASDQTPQAGFPTTPANKGTRAECSPATHSKTTSPAHKEDSNSPVSKELQFSRVILENGEKGRVTKHAGEHVEVIVEKSWEERQLSAKEVTQIEESQAPPLTSVKSSGSANDPTDFSFFSNKAGSGSK